MAGPSILDVEVEELGSDGRPRAVFKWDSMTGRLQMSILPSITMPKTGTSLLHKCMGPFLPAGYPSTVTPDYTPYQIYDSLQAFASTIAGLLASRAVFVGMGVGSEDASLVTTMLLYIAQETIGRVATILFAHQFSQRIEAEVKFYRFFADIVNDTAFVLDCLSPAMPTLGRVVTLCVSNACRAVCGVAGGSSKAILSAHFAKAGNIGELNAKDGSQETVVSLVGMWVGGFVVSRVHGTAATWRCLIPLLAFHLWANWKAVRSVRLSSLNTDRALIFFRGILDGQLKGLDQVGEEEIILGWSNESSGLHGLYPCRFRVGVGLKNLVMTMNNRASHQSQVSGDLVQLFRIFHEEEYVLWFDIETREGIILLKDTATGTTQARSLCHMLRCCIKIQAPTNPPVDAEDVEQDDRGPRSRRITLAREPGEKLHMVQEIMDATEHQSNVSNGRQRSIQLLKDTLYENREQWSRIRDQAEQAGWDLDLTNLVKGHATRIRLNAPLQDKKVK
ncbi:hypothetical protein A1O3_09725 [Capronia epimyces CBS 606.96]|uniref:Protein root UVB sensitive/RUS domain-containing protein n=1 Tax=Capronia epimyces CBS 606.96 TaxID=1182542 RepID=W9Y4X2_9EURO|nr:uncharacterized protein A1O3_09725 [Capronia epimyces CBS 606.96]EXJ77499.1 hypothetical protein A1O3_09725 [Capronia epimyces CBS 606.96]